MRAVQGRPLEGAGVVFIALGILIVIALSRTDLVFAMDGLQPYQPFPITVPRLTLELVHKMGAGQGAKITY